MGEEAVRPDTGLPEDDMPEAGVPNLGGIRLACLWLV